MAKSGPISETQLEKLKKERQEIKETLHINEKYGDNIGKEQVKIMWEEKLAKINNEILDLENTLYPPPPVPPSREPESKGDLGDESNISELLKDWEKTEKEIDNNLLQNKGYQKLKKDADLKKHLAKLTQDFITAGVKPPSEEYMPKPGSKKQYAGKKTGVPSAAAPKSGAAKAPEPSARAGYHPSKGAQKKLSQTGFDQSLLCEVTAWHNNCAANCLSQFIAFKLESGELEKLYGNDPEYNKILDAFKEYYKLPETPSWNDIKLLIQNYPADTDKEGILSPVIRKFIEINMIDNKETLWDFEIQEALMGYMKNGIVEAIYKPLINTNQAKCDSLKDEYQNKIKAVQEAPITLPEENVALEKLVLNDAPKDPNYKKAQAILKQENALPKGKERDKLRVEREALLFPIYNKARSNLKQAKDSKARIKAQVISDREIALIDQIQKKAKDYMLDVGIPKYARHMGDLSKGEMISHNQLGPVMQTLRIGMRVYGPPNDTYYGDPPIKYPWEITLRNKGGYHWQYENFNKDNPNAVQLTKAHNAYYDRNGVKKGQFDLQGSKNIDADIIKNVQAHFNKPKVITRARR